MAENKPKHPVRRVRDLLKDAPDYLHLEKHATASGFARLIGRSASHIRNVECGSVQNWENLAQQIEKRTKVSSKWLLSNPKPEDPVMDVNDEPWLPERHLDRLAPKEGMPNWRYLLDHDPALIPKLMAHLVEAQIVLEISLGRDGFIASMIDLFAKKRTFQNPAMKKVISDFGEVNCPSSIDKAMASKRHQVSLSGYDIKRTHGAKIESAKIEDIVEIVDLQGYGWAKIGGLPDNGLIADAGVFYDKIYPEEASSIADTEIDD